MVPFLGGPHAVFGKYLRKYAVLQKVFWHNYEVFIDKQHAKRIRQFHFAYQKLRGREASPPPKKKTKITTKSWITSPFFDQIIWFFLHLVCLSTVNWCAKKVFIIYHSSWDNSKLLAEPWYPPYPFLGVFWTDKFEHNFWPRTDNKKIFCRLFIWYVRIILHVFALQYHTNSQSYRVLKSLRGG